MTTTIAVMRSAQSVLHRTTLGREKADRIGRQIAERLVQHGNIEKAARRHNTTDEFEIGELAAREYINLILNSTLHMIDADISLGYQKPIPSPILSFPLSRESIGIA